MWTLRPERSLTRPMCSVNFCVVAPLKIRIQQLSSGSSPGPRSPIRLGISTRWKSQLEQYIGNAMSRLITRSRTASWSAGRNCIHMGLSNPGSPTTLPVCSITATYKMLYFVFAYDKDSNFGCPISSSLSPIGSKLTASRPNWPHLWSEMLWPRRSHHFVTAQLSERNDPAF